jgi:hypothetical protein
MLEQLHLSWPIVLSVAGALVIAWGQKDQIVGLLSKLHPTQSASAELSPADRFDRLYALRAWCESVGNVEAVKALDSVVLPAIVQGGPKQ